MEPVGLTVAIHRYRVLFADGEVQDFLAAHQNSDNRDLMLAAHFPKGENTRDVKGVRQQGGIIGVVDMGVEYEHHPGQERLDV